MHTAATRARATGSAARIATDVGAIVALAAERVALHVEERRRTPAAARERARHLRFTATWTAAAVGAVASVPSGPLLGVAAAAVESAFLAEIESRATARLLAMASGGPACHVAAGTRRTMFRAGAHKAATMIAERAARAGARMVLRELGIALPRLGARAVLGPAAPAVGAAWSAAWNALEMHRRLTPAVRAVEEAFGDLSAPCAAPATAFVHAAIARA